MVNYSLISRSYEKTIKDYELKISNQEKDLELLNQENKNLKKLINNITSDFDLIKNNLQIGIIIN